ncbi:MFS transporter-like protein [Paraphoma chrysanthemicola]|nr:MFS transporter-like protein [Paraphoma chrysanthemicola]
MARPKWLSWLTHNGSQPPYMLKLRSSDGFIIGTVALAVFTDMFLYGVIVPVIPFALTTRGHVSWDRVQYWVSVLIAIYGASLLAFSPVCGWMADRGASRRSPLLLGLLALLGSTIMLNVGSSVGVLIVGRILQGASAAVVWVVGLALLADTVPQDQLAQATGWISLGMSLGTLVSPLLGGVVFDRAGYNAVFAMAYALIGLDIVLRLLLVEKKIAVRWNSIAPEQSSVAVCDQSTTPTSTPANSDPEKSRPAEAEHAIVDTTQFRPRRRDQMPPVLSLLYSRRLLAALLCSLLQAALLTSFDSVLPIHAANVFGWTSTGAGLLFLPLVIPGFLAPFFGYLCDKFGGRYFATVGFLGACPPLVCLRFVDENTLEDKVLLCALLAVTGLFLALTFPPIMAEISSVVEAKEKSMLARGHPGFGVGGAYAQAYALFNVAFAGGCMIGPLLAGFIVKDRGWITMAWVIGLMSGAAAVPACLWLGGWIFKQT